jgi:hypothetical protein
MFRLHFATNIEREMTSMSRKAYIDIPRMALGGPVIPGYIAEL